MLKDTDFLRYQRQISLNEIGEPKQQKLLDSHVLLIGCGGLGCAAAAYLAGAGVGTIVIADGDTVDASNLQRQVLYRERDIDAYKTKAMQSHLQQLNSAIRIRTVDTFLTGEQLSLEVSLADIVLDCSDNFATRFELNRTCLQHKTDLISAAAIGWQGQFIWFDFSSSLRDKSAPCYQCLVPETNHSQEKNCNAHGVMGPVVGMLGMMQALQALKVLTNQKHNIANQWHIFDGLTLAWQQFSTTQLPACPACDISTANKEPTDTPLKKGVCHDFN